MKYLTKAQLLEAIKNVPDDSPVIVERECVLGVTLLTGRINAEPTFYGTARFAPTPKGKMTAIAFTHPAEISTGEVVWDHEL